MEDAKIIKLLPDIDPNDLQKDNLVLYEGKPYKVLFISPLDLFIESLETTSKGNQQIRCYPYQLTSMPLKAEICDQLPISINDVPSWISTVHELQNWYYWHHEKRRLELTIK
jgi:hypothetical protein